MGSQLDRFEAGFNRVMLCLAALVAISIGLFAVLIPLNLFLIKFKLGNIWWLYEAVEYALYFGVFIGAPWVLQQGAHVRVDVLTSALPRAAAARVEQALDVAATLLCVVLCFYGVRVTISEFVDGTLPDKDLRIETGYMMAIFALSFLLLAIEFLLRLRRAREIVDEDDGATKESGF
jgi:TRAP-type C4-dicarboxylate transport system permease small subunit